MAKKNDPQRNAHKEIAETTVRALDRGSYVQEEVGEVPIAEAIQRCIENTRIYLPESVLINWASPPSTRSLVGSLQQQPSPTSDKSSTRERECKIIILNVSTLAATRLLATTTSRPAGGGMVPVAGERVQFVLDTEREENKIGVLNFASAKNPGGGFLNGAVAQEESLARSSTLYPSLISPSAEPFYTLNRHDPKAGYYSHAMIYSPGVIFMRDDDGRWLRPMCADVLTVPAVNAKVVRQSLMGRIAARSEAAKIERVMRERAARALYAFERHGVRHLVLGAWGCGVFGNDVRTIACIFADLLGREDGRFRRSFERVVFAVLGADMHKEFEATFEARAQGDGLYTGGEGSTVSLSSSV